MNISVVIHGATLGITPRESKDRGGAEGNDPMTSSSQPSCHLWRDCTNEWGHVMLYRAVRVTSFDCSGMGSIIFIRFRPPCKWINANNRHDPWCKPIPCYDGSSARPDSYVARLTSSPWCHPSQEIAELFRWSSYSPSSRDRRAL